MEIWSISVSLRFQNKFRLQRVNFLPLIPFTLSQKTKGHYTTGGLGLRASLSHLQEVVLQVPTGLTGLLWKPPPPSDFLDSVALRLYCVWNIPGGFSFCWKTLTQRSGGLSLRVEFPPAQSLCRSPSGTHWILLLILSPPPTLCHFSTTTLVLLKRISLWERVSWAQIDLCVAENDWILHSFASTSQVGGLQYLPPCTVYVVNARFRPSASAMPVSTAPLRYSPTPLCNLCCLLYL